MRRFPGWLTSNKSTVRKPRMVRGLPIFDVRFSGGPLNNKSVRVRVDHPRLLPVALRGGHYTTEAEWVAA